MLRHVPLVCKVMLSGIPQEFVLLLTPQPDVPQEQLLLTQQLPVLHVPLVMLSSQPVANLAVQQLLLSYQDQLLLLNGKELPIALFALVHPPLQLLQKLAQPQQLLKPLSHVLNAVLLMPCCKLLPQVVPTVTVFIPQCAFHLQESQVVSLILKLQPMEMMLLD